MKSYNVQLSEQVEEITIKLGESNQQLQILSEISKKDQEAMQKLEVDVSELKKQNSQLQEQL